MYGRDDYCNTNIVIFDQGPSANFWPRLRVMQVFEESSCSYDRLLLFFGDVRFTVCLVITRNHLVQFEHYILRKCHNPLQLVRETFYDQSAIAS